MVGLGNLRNRASKSTVFTHLEPSLISMNFELFEGLKWQNQQNQMPEKWQY